jgi:CYTH domain-containing protein
MNDAPKYSAIEIERRWLVDLALVGDLASFPFREIEDLYVSDSRLRLRKITDASGSTIFKLGKKYGKRSVVAEPVTNLYLTELEHRQLSTLPGATTLKRRYSVAGGALDIYQHPRAGLAVYEVEFDDEISAHAFRPPHFVTCEITAESSLSGVSLAEAHAA